MEEKLMVDNESNSNDNDDHDKTTHSREKYIFGINTQHSQQRHTLCAKVYYYNLRVKLSILFMEIYSIEFAATHTHTHIHARNKDNPKNFKAVTK